MRQEWRRSFTQLTTGCHRADTGKADPRFVTITLPTHIDGAQIEMLRPELMRAVRSAVTVVVLDGAKVELISSAGLGMLVAAALIGAESGVRIEIDRPSELFRQSLALTGLGRHLGIAPEPALV
jgi:anti-anti-sigma factor